MRAGLVLMIGLAACGSDDGGGPFARIDQLTTAYRQAYCPHLVTCGEFPDLPTCLGANIDPSPVAIDPSAITAVLAGTVIYDGNKMAECFSELAAASCDRTLESARVMPSVCTQTLRGTIAGGQACFLDVECVSGLCSIIDCSQSQMCCAGTCNGDVPPVPPPPIAIGQPCGEEGPPCVDGAFCNQEVCTMAMSLGAPCSDIFECAYGLGCIGADVYTCQPLPALGEACPFGECRDEGAVCSTTTMTCELVGLPGATCTTGIACSPFYQCNTMTGQCEPTPRIGESCSSGLRCFDADAYCDPGTLVCTQEADNGAPCTSGDQCKSGQCVNETCGLPTACTP